MSLYQRPSANSGKRASKPQTVTFYDEPVPLSPARDRAHTIHDEEDEEDDFDSRLLDDLQKANTELNKANAEVDKLRSALELANKKLNETAGAYRELKSQLETSRNDSDTLKEDIRVLKEDIRHVNSENERLSFERRDWEQRHIGLNAKYENLKMKYDAISGTVPPSAMTAPLPTEQQRSERSERKEHKDRTERTEIIVERPKTSSRPSSKASSKTSSSGGSKTPSKKDREERHREREERHRERGEERRRDKSRPRDKERERERDRDRDRGHDKENSEAKEAKARLSRRFEDRPAMAAHAGGHRTSFIEGWGPGAGRMQTSNSSNISSSVQYDQKYARDVPRTPNAAGSAHFSSDSSAFDDDNFEDGNYHPYPIVN